MTTPSTALLNALADKLATDFVNGVLTFYTGPMPASPQDAATGTKLGDVTGITWNAAANGQVSAAMPKLSNVMAVTGQVAWARLTKTAESPDTADAAKERMDFTVNTTGADLNLGVGASTMFNSGSTQTISNLTINLNP